MKKIKLSAVFYLVLFYFISAQVGIEKGDIKFDSLYQKISIEISGTDMEKATYLADSLYLNAVNSYQKIKSIHLKAILLGMKGHINLAIEKAHEAENAAAETDYFALKSRIAGFLSTHYKYLKDYKTGNDYWNKSMSFSKLIKDHDESLRIQGLLLQDKGLELYYKKDMKEAIRNLKESEELFKKLSEDIANLAKSRFYLGYCYADVSQNDSAEYYLEKSLKGFNELDYKDNRYISLIELKLTELNHNEQEIKDKAEDVIEFAKKSQSLSHFVEGYNQLSKLEDSAIRLAPLKSKDYMKSMAIDISKIQQISDKKKDTKLQALTQDKNHLTKRNRYILIVSIVLIILLAICFFFYSKRKKQELESFRRIIQDLENKENNLEDNEFLLNSSSNPDEESIYTETDSEKVSSNVFEQISPETEEKLLKRIIKFEKSGKFTDKNISLSVVAGITNMNSRYLSTMIRKHKNQSFNEYIQTLRINYIIKKMKENPNYLDYKISYLAEESGFATHSSFTQIFKKITGMKPSVFMEYLKKENPVQ